MAQELTLPPPLLLRIFGAAEVRDAGESAARFAGAVGFEKPACAEIALVVTELATNLVRHAFGGTLRVGWLQDGARKGIQIESEDAGPGIRDVEQALTDGFSTAGGLGTGLGTVNRLMDNLEFYSNQPTGTRIVCQRWVRHSNTPVFSAALAFGVATRTCRLAAENGDAFIVKRWESAALAGVIDGLGHGQYAQRASFTARHYVEQHYDQPLESIFRGVGRACRTTRGVVMALACFDLARGRLKIASIGNIEVRLFGTDEKRSLIARRGILGLNAPNPVCAEYAWTPKCLLVMHSDGLSTHWDWDMFRAAMQAPPEALAREMLRVLGKHDDDATVVVVKSTAV